jgi:macrolide transport system ATP-binding/permease protein
MSSPALPLLSPLSALVGRDLSRSYGDRTVLDGIDVVASPGQPLGVVGENGVGKSTLLRLLAGVEEPDAGTVVRPAELAYLAQEPDFGAAATVGEVLHDALAPLHAAVARLEELAPDLERPEVADEYAAVLEWAEAHGAWDADRRAEVAAVRLGLGALERDRPVAAMSGGQRSRLALAALVTRRPSCVLLDEPTNHLDDDAVALLEDFLVDLPGVLVVASHDRAFLDAVCGALLDLDPAQPEPGAQRTGGRAGTRFTGGYAAFLADRRAARLRWEQAYAAQQDEIDALRETARTTARNVAHNRPARDNDKFIYHSKGQKVARTVSRRVRDAEQRLEVLDRERIPKPPKKLEFHGELTGRRAASGLVVSGRDVVLAGRVHVPVVDVQAGEQLLVTGANGSGKSTLLKLVAGELEPTGGTLHVRARRVAHLPQDVVFRRPDRTPHEVYDAATGSPVPLGELGLLHPRELSRPVGVLSLGQQRRLALAVQVARQPDLLLLDEPTNHISLALADELEEALQRSAGAVVVASHDRWLRRRWDGLTLAL